MADDMKREWREICAAVTSESDSTKPKNALTLADKIIRKLDEESNKKLENVSAEEKAAGQGAASKQMRFCQLGLSSPTC